MSSHDNAYKNVFSHPKAVHDLRDREDGLRSAVRLRTLRADLNLAELLTLDLKQTMTVGRIQAPLPLRAPAS